MGSFLDSVESKPPSKSALTPSSKSFTLGIVFSSGQALGGHKRSHVASASAATITIAASSSSNLIAPVAPLIGLDLNLPAPVEDDAEVSAVSDAEFVAARA
ncbi:uncharacterized protein A4U43_C10F6230 [Asparagus officinalis]|uniref:C2H2-type domain-containing protein n=1 Tax=Asparagus officinalis TaxID=4686 RepID=A0A5P1E2V7_ASPOF|nr:uncharacterized protein A4U43_C10F6230 [Asparagus officinalis]